MGAGEAFIISDTAAASNVSNTVEATEAYSSAPTLEQGDWAGEWSTAANALNIPAANAGLPILFGHSKFVRISGTDRSVGTDVLRINSTNQDIRGATSGRYCRNSGGADEAASQGYAIFDPASGDDVSVRRSEASLGCDGVGDYDVNLNDPRGLWAVVLPDVDRLYMKIHATASAAGRFQNTPRPIDLSEVSSTYLSIGSWGEVLWDGGDFSTGATFTHSSGTAGVTIAASKKVLSVMTYKTDGPTDRCSVLVKAETAPGATYATVPGSAVSTYTRNANSDIMCGNNVVPVVTGSSAEVMRWHFADQVEEATNTEVDITDASWQLIDMTGYDLCRVVNSVRVSTMLDTQGWELHLWNKTLEAEGVWSHSTSSNTSRITNTSTETVTAIVGVTIFWDRSVATNSQRKVPHTVLYRSGTVIPWHVASEFNRGAQSGDDQMVSGYSYCTVVTFSSGQYAECYTRELSSVSQGGICIAGDLFEGASMFWAWRIDSTGAATPVIETAVPLATLLGVGT